MSYDGVRLNAAGLIDAIVEMKTAGRPVETFTIDSCSMWTPPVLDYPRPKRKPWGGCSWFAPGRKRRKRSGLHKGHAVSRRHRRKKGGRR